MLSKIEQVICIRYKYKALIFVACTSANIYVSITRYEVVITRRTETIRFPHQRRKMFGIVKWNGLQRCPILSSRRNRIIMFIAISICVRKKRYHKTPKFKQKLKTSDL